MSAQLVQNNNKAHDDGQKSSNHKKTSHKVVFELFNWRALWNTVFLVDSKLRFVIQAVIFIFSCLIENYA